MGCDLFTMKKKTEIGLDLVPVIFINCYISITSIPYLLCKYCSLQSDYYLLFLLSLVYIIFEKL